MRFFVLLRRVSVLLACLLSFAVLPATTAHASSESEFVSRTNSARGSNGLAGYGVRGDLTAVARRQAGRMASAGRIYHNPGLGSEVGGWSSVGENVGVGTSVSAIHSAFMGSSGHRANILSRSFTEVGIGTARGSDGRLYVSEVFRRPSGATYTAPVAPRRTSAPVVRRPRRATRSYVRRTTRPPVAVVKPPAKPRRPKVVLPPPAGERVANAWLLYDRARPVASVERALIYLRTGRILAG
jgi:hypothetical protein